MTDASFTGPGQIAILVTAITSLIVTLATLVYNFKREGRRHQWEIEAAARHRETTEAARREREEIAAKVEQAETTLNAKIDENTEISRKAFTEANHINLKLVAQGEAFDKMLEVALKAGSDADVRGIATALFEKDRGDTLDAVAESTADTREKVTEIRDKVVGDGG